MKHLDKFYNKTKIPRVNLIWSKFYSKLKHPHKLDAFMDSFWWKGIIKLFDTFQSFAICNPNKGNTTLFW